MRKQNGFTLIELMIVVAIVGILAAIAIPAYKDFQVRSKISEALAAMGACKTTVAEFYQSNNGWVTRNGLGVPIDTDICQDAALAGGQSAYVSAMVVAPGNGTITTTLQNTGADPAGTVVTMFPADAAGTLVVAPNPIQVWVCGGAGTTTPSRYLPGSCQG